MERVTEFVFYDLAVKIHSLSELNDRSTYSGVWWTLWNAREALNELYSQRRVNFVTPAASRLYNAITAIVPKDWSDAVAKLPRKTMEGSPEVEVVVEEPQIYFWQITEIQAAVTEFETVLRTECQMMDTYFISKKGAYSTKDLVENAHYQVPQPSRGNLPQTTRDDFDQAGKCIAFDVPTAAAFHLLRGTEAVIREYYDLVVPGNKKAAPHMRSWGVYIRLMKKYKAESTIMGLLTMIKDVYRNPVIHPEEIYTDERIQVLFGLCVSAVVMLEGEIQKLKAKGGTIAFPTTGSIAVGSGKP
jgi:hypothetical protein